METFRIRDLFPDDPLREEDYPDTPFVTTSNSSKIEELRIALLCPELKPHEKISLKRFETWLSAN